MSSNILSNARKPASGPTPAATMTTCSNPLSHSDKADQNYVFADSETLTNVFVIDVFVSQNSPFSTECRPISHDITNLNATSSSKQFAPSPKTVPETSKSENLPLSVSQPDLILKFELDVISN